MALLACPLERPMVLGEWGVARDLTRFNAPKAINPLPNNATTEQVDRGDDSLD
jgi:hypothetical protein